MTTNNNRYFTIIFPSALLAVALVLILFMFSGCNAEKRAVKKSDNHFFKAVAWDKANVHGRCSDIAPPIVMTKDSFIYKQGETIKVQLPPKYITVDCDSLIAGKKDSKNKNTFTIPCPPCDSTYRLDSFLRSSHNVAVDNNKVKALEGVVASKDAIISQLNNEIASKSTTNRYLWAAGGFAWVLIIVWIIKKVWWK